jgi:predicted O-methyltransferase YrrM
MNIERALATCGWMSEGELAYLAQTASKSTSIAEIGSWKGRSTLAIACNTPGIVYAVDTWEGTEQQGDELKQHEEGWLIEEFKQNIAGIDNINIYQGTSIEVAQRLKELGIAFDMIFIDAYHTYEAAKNDILAWRPLLCEGGILCGHDYTTNWPGIIQAVKELVPQYRLVESIWTTEAA